MRHSFALFSSVDIEVTPLCAACSVSKQENSWMKVDEYLLRLYFDDVGLHFSATNCSW